MFEFELKWGSFFFILFFFRKMDQLLVLVLRGITGVGKSFLRKMLKLGLEKMGKKVGVINKDNYRRFLDEREGYHYTQEEERRVSEWYRTTWENMSANTFYDVIICDNTNVRSSEISIPLFMRDPIGGRKIKTVIIQIGDPDSSTESTVPKHIIERMRQDMKVSEKVVDDALARGDATLIELPPKSAIETGVSDLIQECYDC